MKKNGILGNLILILLFILAIPFILIMLILFIIVYIVFFIFEGIYYFRSKYYKLLKERYYLLITQTRNYKKFNNIIKGSTVSKLDNLLVIEKSNLVLVEVNKNITYDNLELVWLLEDTDLFEYLKKWLNVNKELYILIKKECIDKNFINEAKYDDRFVIYAN